MVGERRAQNANMCFQWLCRGARLVYYPFMTYWTILWYCSYANRHFFSHSSYIFLALTLEYDCMKCLFQCPHKALNQRKISIEKRSENGKIIRRRIKSEIKWMNINDMTRCLASCSINHAISSSFQPFLLFACVNKRTCVCRVGWGCKYVMCCKLSTKIKKMSI